MLVNMAKSPILKAIALFLLIGIVVELFQPMRLFALSGGPAQPEMAGFTPSNTENMVDLFSGNFHYSIPLMTVPGFHDGYPITLNYSAETGMESEASWVGLGWNLNPGAITRQVRGLPDDFKGESIKKTYKRRNNNTFVFTTGVGGEVFGANFGIGVSTSQTFVYNTYNGISLSRRFGLSSSYVRGNNIESPRSKLATLSGSLTLDSDNGITRSFSMNGGAKNLGLGFNYGYNSKSGVYTYGTHFSLSTSDKERGIRSMGFSVGNSFSTAAILPPIHIPFNSTTFGLSFQFGGCGVYLEGFGSIAASVCIQSTPSNTIGTPAYGLCYAENANSNSLQDFNREKELCVSHDSKNLPLPIMTHDIYNITGELMHGSFRAYRSDFGHFFDNYVSNETSTTEVGGDAAVGSGLQAGLNLSLSSGDNASGDWASDAYDSRLSYKDKNSYKNQSKTVINPSLYEPFYFKISGEQTAVEQNHLNPISGSGAVSFQLNQESGKSFWDVLTNNYTISNALNNGKSITQYEQSARTKRNYNVEYKTGKVSPLGQDHHFKEFSIVNDQGERYTYGKTLYNKVEKEVIFSVPAYNGVGKTTLSYGNEYNSGQASGSNRVGKEQLYSCTETPAYAHSYLITNITAPDYVDLNNDATPDDNDLGDWVKFNYVDKYSGNGNLYRWRFPYEGANYFMGDRSNKTDDKGSYSYGEKEISYVEFIETRTHKAQFHISKRADALGTNGEYGGGRGNGSAELYKLDSIRLFSKEDTSTPIQTAVFEYDYSLCQKVPNNTNTNSNNSNNNQGKLTLKSVYIKYGKSVKGKTTPYRFLYGNNPNYDPTKMDRWGNYKGNANYFEHYVTQNKKQADSWASAWLLTKIELPSGGTIAVEYESDDYAYVQDQQAMFMATVIHVSFAKENGAYYIYFDKDKSIAASEYVSGFKNNLMFFKIADRYDGNKDPDYIQGYIEVVPESATNGADATIGKVKVEPFKAFDAHPILFLAWQYLKNNRPDLLFNNADAAENQSDAKAFFNALASKGFFKKVTAMYGGNGGFYSMCKKSNEYNHPDYKNTEMPSYVRLQVPTKIKYGGGSRVKTLTMQDNWTKSESSSYQQEYYYRKMENGKIISSGVAEYEPTVCGEETALRYPVYDKVTKTFFVEDEMYSEEPYGESYFPAANVGYSQVIVKTVTPDSVKFTAAGVRRYEFYTAKDFPIKVEQTPLYTKNDGVPNLLSILTAGFKQSNTSAYSQGYAIELNNMHGQQKSVSVSPYIPVSGGVNQWIAAVEISGYISKIEYLYKTTNGGKQIDNVVDVLLDDGVAAKKILGQTYDFVIDQREDYSKCIGGGAATQFMLATWFPPVFGASGMAMIDCFEERVRSVATTKVIYNTGILEQIKSYDKGALTTTKYLQFDPNTGSPLLTSTTNEFEKPIFTYNIPAYWTYPNMGNAADNYRAMFFNANLNSTRIFDTCDRVDNNLPIKKINGASAEYWNSNCTIVSSPLVGKEILRSRFSNQTGVMAATIVSLSDPANPANRRVPMLEQSNKSTSINPTCVCFPYTNCAGYQYYARIEYVSETLYFFKGDNKEWICNAQWIDLINMGNYVSGVVKNINLTPLSDYRFVKKGNIVYIYDKDKQQVGSFTWNNNRQVFEECMDGVLQASAVEYKNDYALTYADAGVAKPCAGYYGLNNIYRPQRSNLYVTDRTQTGIDYSYQTNVGYDGAFRTFQPFALKTGNQNNKQKPWTWNAEITLYNPFNVEIENRDALNIYSSALYGYKNSLVTAVTKNARYDEMGFDSFENDSQIGTNTPRGHFSYANGSRSVDFAHTGNYSWKTNNNQLTIKANVVASPSKFVHDGTLALLKDSSYVFSCWVRKADCATIENNGNTYQWQISGTNAISINKEPKIDCWQRIEVLFTPKQIGNGVSLTLTLSPLSNFYVDDIRVMPAHASMKSYVYNPANYRLMAELDENNYATFYNYDEEGILIQIKKETEKGIQTLKTTRQNLPNKP